MAALQGVGQHKTKYMAKLSGMAIVMVTEFHGSKAKPAIPVDGKYPVVLTPIAGKIPNKAIIHPAINEQLGFLPGKQWVASWIESDFNEEFQSRQFTWANAGAVTPVEVVTLRKELGDPESINVLTQAEIDRAVERQMVYEEKIATQKQQQKEKINA